MSHDKSNTHKPHAVVPIASAKLGKGPSRRARVTDGKVSSPEEPIYRLQAKFEKHLYLPDPTTFYAMCGTVAGNMLAGNPAWLMLVGQSSSGKSELLRALSDIPKTEVVTSIENNSAFLSATKKKDRSHDATGGLLGKIGTKGGALIWLEFTAVLEQDRNALKKMLTTLRSLHDGHWDRPVGADGGGKLEWDGRLAILAGVTNAIDRAHEFSSTLGERFVFCRMPKTDGFGEALKSSQTVDPKAMRADLRRAIAECFDSLGLSWTSNTATASLTKQEEIRMIALSEIAAKGRGPVIWDFQKREVIDVPEGELPARFNNTFKQQYLGMEYMGLNETDRWKVLEKMTFDSMTKLRLIAMRAVVEASERNTGASVAEIGALTQCSDTTVERTMKELQIYSLVDKYSGTYWTLTEWAKLRLKIGRGEKHK